MRKYEALYVIDVDTSEEQLETILEKYKKVVVSTGGEIISANKWEGGRRRLAYEVAGRREGIFILMNFDSGADTPLELDRVFRISDEVFRHIIVLRQEVPPPPVPVAAPAPAAPTEEAPAVAEAVAEAPAPVAEVAEPAVEETPEPVAAEPETAPAVEESPVEAEASPEDAEPEAAADAEPKES